MALVFDATYNNADVMRKVRETQKAFAELGNIAEIQGRRIDAAFEKISLKSLERMMEIMKNFPKEIQGLSSFQKQIDGLEKHIERVNQRIASVGGGKLGSTFSDVSGNINIGDVLKEQVYVGSQAVNGLTEKIIQQRILIKDVEGDVRALGEAYKRAGEGTTKGNAIFADFKAAKAALQEEKNALFELQTQQAQARLSVRKLRDEQSLYQKEAQDVASANEKMSLSFQKANALMAQMVQTAAKTPFNLTELANGAKQLVAYGFASEGINDTLIRLGNIAAGLGLPLERLTYLYGTTMTQGRLYARDLMQFTTSGIPMLQGLADMFGVSTDKVNEMVTAGQIGFPQVEKVIENMTNQGGKFFNLMEEQSKTITGKISNLGDAWDSMLNKIGQSQEGIINDSIDSMKYMIENYEKIGSILLSLIEIYGVYRTACIAHIVLTQSLGTTQIMLGATMAKLRSSFIALTASMNLNPLVLASTAIIGLGVVMWNLADNTDAVTKAQNKLNDELDKFKQKEEERKQKIESLIRTIQDETETELAKVKAYEGLQRLSPTLTDAYKREELAVASLADTNKELNKVRDVESYDNIIAKIENYKKKVQELTKERDRYKGGKSDFAQDQYVKLDAQLEANEKMLAQYNTQLDEYNRLKREAEDNAKPVEVRLEAAKANEMNIREALETIDNLILTKKREVEGNEIKVPLSIDGAEQEAESFENKINALKTKVEGTDIKVPFKPNEHLDKIPSLFEQEKDNWVKMGAFTVPVSIEIERNKITNILDAAQNTIASLMQGNTTQTYKEAYSTAEREWKAAQKALEESKKKSKADYDKAKKDLDEKEKNYKDLGGNTNTTKQESAAEKLRKEQEAIREQQDKNAQLDKKQSLDRIRQQQDLENQAAQAEIDALGDSFEKKEKQRILNNKKEIQTLERQKEDYINAVIQLAREKFNAEEELNAKQKKGYVKKTFDVSTVDTSKQSSSWDKIIKNTETKQGLNEWEQREASMNEYLIKYGTFSQKKEAIDKKYRDAINLETDLGKKNTLQKEWGEATSNLDLSKLEQEINWEMIFGDLSKVTKEQLVKIKDQLQEFKKSPEFKNATPENIQVIEGAINSINNAMVDKGGFFGGMVDSVNELKIATEELKKAEEELAEANKNGTEAEKEEAQKKVNKAQNKKQNAETNVTKSSDKTIDHLTAVGNAIAQLGSSAEMSLSSFGNAAGSIVDAFTEAGSKVGGLVGAAFSVLEGVQKQGLDGFVGNVLGNVVGAVGGIFDTLTFGAFGLSGADYSGYNEMVSQYELLSDTWDELIDKKREYIDISYGAEALKSGEEALAIIDKSQDAQRNLAKARADSGGSVGSHSIAYRQNRNLGNYASELYKYVAQNGNYNDITNALLGATEEQLKKVAEQMPELWAGLDGNFREHLNNIISGAEQTKEVLAQMKEAVTGISLDEFSGGYIDMLSDLDSTNEDFADNFEKYLQKAIFQSLIANKYKSDIEGLYNSWDELGKDGLTNEEAEDLRKKQQELTDNMLADRDKLMNDFGWQSESTSQEATNGGFQTMSQDTGSELNGRFTALQISNEEIKNSMLAMLTGVNLISTTTVSNGITLMEIKNVALMSNSHLEDIAGFQKRIITNLDTKLANIERSTKIMAGS